MNVIREGERSERRDEEMVSAEKRIDQVACLRNALEKIQKLTDQFDEGDAYEDIDALQEFENRVSDIVEIALAKSV